MEVFGIVFIVLASVLFATCNILCCLCAGRGGRVKQPNLQPDIQKGTKKATSCIGRATRDGNMVVLAGAGAAVAGTAVASGVRTSDDKCDRDKGNSNSGSGGRGVPVVGGGGKDNSGANSGCCCGGGDGGSGGGCGGCGGCGG
ncbi:hypothetical protein BC332_07520 [Capsicum chinense]|nr:hypothetical protein BC332_07520 [Capsicum chinense]